ncbi:MAG: hypothetical protein M3O82_01860 [Verrucomicrobiota bacterium]|nr:hypothetical protein [Verrucomicrobiota bacterium]
MSAIAPEVGGQRSEVKWSLELVALADGSEAILYIYFGGMCIHTAVGCAKELRYFARENYAGALFHETVMQGWFEIREPEAAT